MLRPFLSMTAMAVALLFSAMGCKLGLSEDAAPDQQRNDCSEGDQCRGGVCLGGICRAQSTDLGALLLHVTPPTGTPMIAGVGFTSVVEELAFESGPSGYAINLGHVSKLIGTVVAEAISKANCVVDPSMPAAKEVKDGSIAARITLIPRARLWGLPVPSYTVDVTDIRNDSYQLDLLVPPGRYDIYVQPQATADGCVHPPYFALDRELKSGSVKLDVNLPEPQALRVRVMGSGLDLRGWTLEILERNSGRRLSNRAPILQVSDSLEEYTARVAYSQVEGSELAPASELVLLAPPEDIIGPSVYVERSVVELFQDGDGLIDQLTTLPRPVTFSARVGQGTAIDPVEANVLLFATRLASTGPGTVAAFSRTVSTDLAGLFSAQILPGTYRVVVQPLDEKLSPVETEINVSDAELQAGKTILIDERSQVTGRLVDFYGGPIPGVPVMMRAMEQGSLPSVLELAQGQQPFVPIATSASTSANGSFELKADQGSFHLSLHPVEDSGYPWLVRLGQVVSEESLNLGKLPLSLPVAVSGVLTSGDLGDVVPKARIVVYAMLKDGQVVAHQADATQVVPVAESRSDENGHFRLLLPSKLN